MVNNMIVDRIENAIQCGDEIMILMDVGCNTGSSISIVPEALDNGMESCIIYFDNGIYNFDINNAIYNEEEDEFICASDGCRVVVSF